MTGIHPFTVWMRTIHAMVELHKPQSLHVFWDCKTSDNFRKAIYEDYKAHRSTEDRHEDFSIGKVLNQLESAAKDLLPHMNVRQYHKDHQEADDLIYAASVAVGPNNAIIISSDNDIIQIPWYMDYVKVYDPLKSRFMERPDVNPIYQKALSGDKSDNISGYKGIGEVKSKRLLQDLDKLKVFLKESGASIFKRNISLVDLRKNPFMNDNVEYVKKVMASDVGYNKDNIIKIISENKIRGFMSEYHDLVTPLKKMN